MVLLSVNPAFPPDDPERTGEERVATHLADLARKRGFKISRQAGLLGKKNLLFRLKSPTRRNAAQRKRNSSSNASWTRNTGNWAPKSSANAETARKRRLHTCNALLGDLKHLSVVNGGVP